MTTTELLSDCEDQLEEKEYEIEVYELYATAYRIKAINAASAIRKVFDGDFDPGDEVASEFVESAEEYGMSADNIPEDDLEEFMDEGLLHENGFVNCVRAIRETKGS